MERSFVRILTKIPGLIPQYANTQSTLPISRDDHFIMKKNQGHSRSKGGIVYSTSTTGEAPKGVTQKLRVRFESKHHGGKTVTLIDGFVWDETRIEALAKKLKNRCGTGGSVKDRVILLQGDFREKALKLLAEEGLDAR